MCSSSTTINSTHDTLFHPRLNDLTLVWNKTPEDSAPFWNVLVASKVHRELQKTEELKDTQTV